MFMHSKEILKHKAFDVIRKSLIKQYMPEQYEDIFTSDETDQLLDKE